MQTFWIPAFGGIQPDTTYRGFLFLDSQGEFLYNTSHTKRKKFMGEPSLLDKTFNIIMKRMVERLGRGE